MIATKQVLIYQRQHTLDICSKLIGTREYAAKKYLSLSIQSLLSLLILLLLLQLLQLLSILIQKIKTKIIIITIIIAATIIISGIVNSHYYYCYIVISAE